MHGTRYCFSVLFVAALISSTSRAAEERTQPNILLIVADDLGFSDLGCYGGEIESPNLDRLSAQGLRLTQFYSTGRCCPSRGSLLTGQYSHRVGLGHMTIDLGQPGYQGRLADEGVTVAQMLAPAGYRRFLSGKWHLGTKDPTQHGFEEFYGTLVSAKTFWDPDHFLRLPADRKRRAYDAENFYGTDALTDHALDFLKLARTTPKQPWFVYLAYNAPHFPLHAPAETIEKYAQRYTGGWDQLRSDRFKRMKQLGIVPADTKLTPRSPYYDWGTAAPGDNPAWETLGADRRADLARRMAIYAAMIDRMDQNIGRVLADLKEHGELENTLIVFTSDNGACAEWDPFGFDIKSGPKNILHRGEDLAKMGSRSTYHSAGSGWANASNAPWRMYKHYNHEGGIAVPCIVHWPGKVASGGRIDATPTHLIDLVPTFLAAAGAKPADANSKAPAMSLPGADLQPLLQAKSLPDRDLFFEHEGNRAVRSGQWKLVALRNEDWELYDMSSDRTELRNLVQEETAIAKRLAKSWDDWAAKNHVTPMPAQYGTGYLPK